MCVLFTPGPWPVSDDMTDEDRAAMLADWTAQIDGEPADECDGTP